MVEHTHSRMRLAMAPEPLLSVCHRVELIETIAGETGILCKPPVQLV